MNFKNSCCDLKIRGLGAKLCVAFLLLQEQIHINHVICDRYKNSIKQVKGKILESITPEEFHLVEKIHQNAFKKLFDLTKKR